MVDLFIFNDENGIRSCILQVLNCETQFFDSHFNAYVISTHLPCMFHFINVSSLPFFPVLHAHKPFSKSEICLVLNEEVGRKILTARQTR